MIQRCRCRSNSRKMFFKNNQSSKKNLTNKRRTQIHTRSKQDVWLLWLCFSLFSSEQWVFMSGCKSRTSKNYILNCNLQIRIIQDNKQRLQRPRMYYSARPKARLIIQMIQKKEIYQTQEKVKISNLMKKNYKKSKNRKKKQTQNTHSKN